MATNKQKRVVKKIVENRGLSISEAMRQSGYDDTTAHNPKNLTDSKGWRELLEEIIPDELLDKVGLDGLVATKKDSYTGEVLPDYQARFNFWKEYQKLKDKYPATKQQIGGMSDTPLTIRVVDGDTPVE